MQCFLSCVLWAVMCFEGCGVCSVTVALHVSVLCVCSAWCSCVRMYVWCCLMRACVCTVLCVKCVPFVFFVGYVCFACGFVSIVCVSRV